jgi:hypothetical protein
MRGCLDGMLPLVSLGLGAKPRFGWLEPEAVSGCAAGVGHVGTSASVFIFCVVKLLRSSGRRAGSTHLG